MNREHELKTGSISAGLADQSPRERIIFWLRARLLGSFDANTSDAGNLPGERQIAEQLSDVSRVPVREALTVLRALGVISVDKGRQQYHARTLEIYAGKEESGRGQSAPSLCDLEILRRELLGGVRILLEFCHDALQGSHAYSHKPLKDLEDLLDRYPADYWYGLGPVETILKVNDLLADAAFSLGLGRTSDNIRAHLDILELSVAHARNELLARSPRADFPVFPQKQATNRAICIKRFLRSCLEDREDFVEFHLEGFKTYLIYIVSIACAANPDVPHGHEEPESIPVWFGSKLSAVF